MNEKHCGCTLDGFDGLKWSECQYPTALVRIATLGATIEHLQKTIATIGIFTAGGHPPIEFECTACGAWSNDSNAIEHDDDCVVKAAKEFVERMERD